MDTIMHYVGLIIGAALTGALIFLIPVIIRLIRKEKTDWKSEMLGGAVLNSVICFVLSLFFGTAWIGTFSAVITLMVAMTSLNDKKEQT